MTDSRAADYVSRFGDKSWELEPTVIRDLIRDAIMRVRDEKAWDAALGREVADLEDLGQMIEQMSEGSGEEQ
jgi:hypothetical protein